MEMMRGNEELLQSVVNNRDLLKKENCKLHLQEEELQEKVKNECKRMRKYIDDLGQYVKMRKIEFNSALKNFLEISATGLLVMAIFNFVDNDVHTIFQALNNIETGVILGATTFGNLIIIGDSVSTLHSFKKENLNDGDIKEIIAARDNYYTELEEVRKNIKIVTEKLNKYNTRIAEITSTISPEKIYYNEYEEEVNENTLEKSVQKVKM